MTTNKPGSETQQPLFGCIICYEYVTYPADHLRVYNGECWCESCWECATHEIADGLDWGELEPFKPALQAECEKLRKHLQNLIDQTTPLEPEPGNPMWSRRIQLDEVIAERDQLRAECEQLRRDAERYQSLMEAVLREIPHREGRRGNAPGHGHSVPGVWDCDNGALAGKKCAWCKVWNEALTALQKEHKP